ncbi:hypothetical protein GQ53DRAFT_228928 [Thozetella sp. PMI_491]|nr:hypothetical protein GQ53DRAFT_228928 [Thozetella sp. PMI_491]
MDTLSTQPRNPRTFHDGCLRLGQHPTSLATSLARRLSEPEDATLPGAAGSQSPRRPTVLDLRLIMYYGISCRAFWRSLARCLSAPAGGRRSTWRKRRRGLFASSLARLKDKPRNWVVSSIWLGRRSSAAQLPIPCSVDPGEVRRCCCCRRRRRSCRCRRGTAASRWSSDTREPLAGFCR